MSNWYPQNYEELNKITNNFLSNSLQPNFYEKEIHGLIVPHAGYEFSGEISGKAYSLLKNKNNSEKTAIILAPSHYFALTGIKTHDKDNWKTPLGNIEIAENNLSKAYISKEHAIDNQIPFLQALGFKKILPIIVGEISQSQAKDIAKTLSTKEGIFIISTDLSHFNEYSKAQEIDKNTIKIISSLDTKNISKIDACGIYPLMIFLELCKIKNWNPELIEYKNSGDIIRDKDSVVGYASFVF